MIIRYFYEEKLAQASYLVGCSATGEAIVIDPNRDIQPYIDTASAQGLRVTAVTETHIHADYLSGTRELAAATGARIYLSDEGGPDWKYQFAQDPNVNLLHDGDVVKIGNLSLKAIHTPGHTPEHMVFLLTDHPASSEPHSLFTGDFVFVGDVGRPDLLERAANMAGTMEAGAQDLYRSLQKLNDFPEYLLLWPGHGAGSACGKALGGSPVTTLGYERLANWALKVHSEDKFVDEILSGQPEPPRYFKEMKRLNKLGPTVLGSLPIPVRLEKPVGNLVDVRSFEEVQAGCLLGAVTIPRCRALTTWAGWLLSYDEPVTFVATNQDAANEAARDLATIGLDMVAGWVHPQQLDPADFAPVNEIPGCDYDPNAFLLDIRGMNERRESFIAGSVHIPLGDLRDRLSELPKDQKIVIYCSGGGRSPIAYSILRNAGFTDIWDLTGGLNIIESKRPELVQTGPS